MSGCFERISEVLYAQVDDNKVRLSQSPTGAGDSFLVFMDDAKYLLQFLNAQLPEGERFVDPKNHEKIGVCTNCESCFDGSGSVPVHDGKEYCPDCEIPLQEALLYSAPALAASTPNKEPGDSQTTYATELVGIGEDKAIHCKSDGGHVFIPWEIVEQAWKQWGSGLSESDLKWLFGQARDVSRSDITHSTRVNVLEWAYKELKYRNAAPTPNKPESEGEPSLNDGEAQPGEYRGPYDTATLIEDAARDIQTNPTNPLYRPYTDGQTRAQELVRFMLGIEHSLVAEALGAESDPDELVYARYGDIGWFKDDSGSTSLEIGGASSFQRSHIEYLFPELLGRGRLHLIPVSKSYPFRHAEAVKNGMTVGKRVRILDRRDREPDGWDGEWNELREWQVDHSGELTRDLGLKGFEVTGNGFRVFFPADALELIEEGGISDFDKSPQSPYRRQKNAGKWAVSMLANMKDGSQTVGTWVGEADDDHHAITLAVGRASNDPGVDSITRCHPILVGDPELNTQHSEL